MTFSSLTLSEDFCELLEDIQKLFLFSSQMMNIDGFKSILEEKLKDLGSQIYVLKLILISTYSFDDIKYIYKYIVDLALDGNLTTIPLARTIIAKYSYNQDANIELEKILDQYMSSNDYYIYMRIAELILIMYNKNSFLKLMNICKNSNIDDIYEVYDYFKEKLIYDYEY